LKLEKRTQLQEKEIHDTDGKRKRREGYFRGKAKASDKHRTKTEISSSWVAGIVHRKKRGKSWGEGAGVKRRN